MSRHTLLLLVENKPGVLARVAALFARRRYSIETLVAEPVPGTGLSRMTVGVDIGALEITQVVHQIDKLVNVLEVAEPHRQAPARPEPAGPAPLRDTAPVPPPPVGPSMTNPPAAAA